MATQKAKRAAKLKLENPHKSMGEVMVQAGYSEHTAKHPKSLTESKGWTELMEEYLPDAHLGEKHREFLDTPRYVRKYAKGEIEYETEETDPSAVKALDMAYKLKRRYGDVNIGQALIVQISNATAKKYGIDASTGTNSQ